MGSGASLFFNLHATFLDDPAWNISREVKDELGNILSWMLADDFYKMGGVGKYVVGGILCLAVYAGKAGETSANRKRKIEARKLALAGAGKPSQTPVSPAPKDLPQPAGLASGPLGQVLETYAPKAS